MPAGDRQKLSSLLDAEPTFAINLHGAISRIVRVHLMRGCVRTTLVSTHTHERIYACMTKGALGGGGVAEGARSAGSGITEVGDG